MKNKRILSMVLAGITTFSLVACGNTPEQKETSAQPVESGASQVSQTSDDVAPNTVKSDETLVVSMASEPATLWCLGTGMQDNQSLFIQNCITDRLVIYDMETKEVLPCLATEWEWIDDKRIQFTLRDDVLMSDGTPLEAADVVYTFETAAEYSANNDIGRYFDAETTEVVDEHNVIVGMNVIAPDFLITLAEASFGIVSEGDIEAAGGREAAAKNPVMGAGKYKFKEWSSGQYIVLERNEDYWDDSYTGYYKEIRFNFTNDAATRQMAVESGDAGIALDIPTNIAATLVENQAIQTQIYPTEQVMHLFFNCKDGVCTDKSVREAIRYALDLNAINQVSTMGYGEISNGWFSPGGTYYYDAFKDEDRSQNIEMAKQILEDAGYGDGLSLTTISRQDNISTLTVIQEQLRLAGINLNVESLDTAQFVTEAKAGNYDIILTGSNVETRKPTIFTFFQTGNVESVIGGSKFTTDEIDSKIWQMVATSDNEEAKKLAAEIIQTIKDECYAVDLYTEYKAVVIRPEIVGFKPLERGSVDLTSLYVIQ